MAVIDQSAAGTGNFAAISQGNNTTNAGIPFVSEVGNDNVAFIKQ